MRKIKVIPFPNANTNAISKSLNYSGELEEEGYGFLGCWSLKSGGCV